MQRVVADCITPNTHLVKTNPCLLQIRKTDTFLAKPMAEKTFLQMIKYQFLGTIETELSNETYNMLNKKFNIL